MRGGTEPHLRVVVLGAHGARLTGQGETMWYDVLAPCGYVFPGPASPEGVMMACDWFGSENVFVSPLGDLPPDIRQGLADACGTPAGAQFVAGLLGFGED